MGGDLKIELVESRSALPMARAQWNALVARNETNTLFQTYEWFDAWWQALARHRKLFFLVVRRGAEVIGFAPLMLRRTALGLRQLEFIGTGNSDYQDFVFSDDKPAALAALCVFLKKHAGSWDRLWLANVPQSSSTISELANAAAASGLKLVGEAVVRCPVLLLENRVEAARELVGRYSVRRPVNWFSARGRLSWRHVTDAAELESLLPTFFEQHVARWRSTGRPSLFESPEQRDFYVALARTLQPTGWLSFFVIEFDHRPIAFHFGFDYQGSIVWYKPSFAPEYAARSPGLLLMRQLIEDAVAGAKKELDFTIGDEPFKSRFANHERFNVYASIYPSRTVGQIAEGIKALRRAGGWLKRRMATARQ